MNAIYLSGESIHNKDWIYDTQDKLAPLFDKTIVQNYDHWDAGTPEINLNSELEKLALNAQNIDDYIIIAKSIGTVLATEAIAKNLINPQKCIFLGVPINIIQKQGYPFAENLKFVNCPVLFIQNSDDPVGKYRQLTEFINNLYMPRLQYKIVELPGDTHNYIDYPKLLELTKQFIEQ